MSRSGTNSLFIDLHGQTFGYLKVLHRDGVKSPVKWICECSKCGKTISVQSGALRSGRQVSCGCKKHDGHGTKHGKSKTRTYTIWEGMIGRCCNRNDSTYDGYGGSGISVSKEWKSFEVFLEDMGECPEKFSIDRIDNSKGYSKDNCRWADNYTQSRNRSNNIFLEFSGLMLCVSDWGYLSGIGKAFQARINLGWEIDKALFTPIKNKHPTQWQVDNLPLHIKGLPLEVPDFNKGVLHKNNLQG